MAQSKKYMSYAREDWAYNFKENYLSTNISHTKMEWSLCCRSKTARQVFLGHGPLHVIEENHKAATLQKRRMKMIATPFLTPAISGAT